jgi:AraC-like DNA-binding protein
LSWSRLPSIDHRYRETLKIAANAVGLERCLIETVVNSDGYVPSVSPIADKPLVHCMAKKSGEVAVIERTKSIEQRRGQSEFIHFEERNSDHPFVEKVWGCHSERADSFLSVAANNFEMVVTRLDGKSSITLRGPETAATTLDCPADGEWIAIRFKAGTFMSRFLPGSLRDHNDVTLPSATGRSFWLNGSALEYPTLENAETFVKRLTNSGMLLRDPMVRDTLLRRPTEFSLRSVQRRFLRSAGVTYAILRQIERARLATNLLREGVATLDVVSRLGYFDQPHLARSLRRFIGQTPTQIARREQQLSFLYKTNSSAENIVPL